jgi:N-acetylglucosaminyl-diphospho-decaprenol L-rhamnosyltransferase
MVQGTVVIVTHNSADCIARCLQALVPFPEWKVVVVDNDSRDDSVGVARTIPITVHMLINSHNVGFAAAVNQGMKVAEGPTLLILNPDAVASAGSLYNLAKALRRDAVGAAGGLLLNEGGLPQKGFTVRRFPTIGSVLAEVLLVNRIWPSNPWNVRYRCLDLDYQAAQEVEQPAGACLAVKRQAWEMVEGFDESFFPVWFEDVDFCRRLRDRGWRIVYCPDAIFLHAGAHSVDRLAFRDRQSFWYRNLRRYFAKHHSRSEVAFLRLGITVGMLLRTLLSLVGFRPSGTSVAEVLGTYWKVAWYQAIRGRDT